MTIADDIPGMYADIDEPAKYYCEMVPRMLNKPKFLCNTISLDGKFDSRDTEDNTSYGSKCES